MTNNRNEQKQGELKPCPFCGEYAACNLPQNGGFVTECAHCGVQTDEYLTVEAAQRIWNTRSDVLIIDGQEINHPTSDKE